MRRALTREGNDRSNRGQENHDRSASRVETPLTYISATASMTARTDRRPRPERLRTEGLSLVPGGLGHLHIHRARGRVDPLGPAAVGIAVTLGRAPVMARAEKPLALDLHRKFESPREHRCDLAGSVFDQLFQDHLKRRILPLVHSFFSMVVLQLHGIPEWAACAGARPSTGSCPKAQMNFQT